MSWTVAVIGARLGFRCERVQVDMMEENVSMSKGFLSLQSGGKELGGVTKFQDLN